MLVYNLVIQYFIDVYEEVLPFDLPSSFRGQAVKYSYKIKIGLQRVGSPIKMLHLPFRLMTMQCMTIFKFEFENNRL